MPLIDLNFKDVPNTQLPPDPGVYNWEVVKVSSKTRDNGTAYHLLELAILDGPLAKRRHSEFFDADSLRTPVSNDAIKLKQLLKASGFKLEELEHGIDLDTLVGKTFKAEMKHSAGKDKTTGEARVYGNLKYGA